MTGVYKEEDRMLDFGFWILDFDVVLGVNEENLSRMGKIQRVAVI